jgi:hypothetical protein
MFSRRLGDTTPKSKTEEIEVDMTTMTETTTLNGIDLNLLRTTVDAITKESSQGADALGSHFALAWVEPDTGYRAWTRCVIGGKKVAKETSHDQGLTSRRTLARTAPVFFFLTPNPPGISPGRSQRLT